MPLGKALLALFRSKNDTSPLWAQQGQQLRHTKRLNEKCKSRALHLYIQCNFWNLTVVAVAGKSVLAD